MASDSPSEHGACPSSPLEFSVVVTCYNEALCIDEFHARLSQTMKQLGRSHEIIFVDDGSGDDTFAHFNAFFDKDPSVSAIIRLAFNAGQEAAITAGYEYAQGRHAIVIDSDLQFDPEEIPLLVAEYDKGFDLVSGWRKNRKDPFIRRYGSAILGKVIRFFSPNALRDTGCNFKIINLEIVHSFRVGPFRPIRPLLMLNSVSRASEVPVTHHPRTKGKSGWTPHRLAVRFFDAILDHGRQKIFLAAALFLPLLGAIAILADIRALLAAVCAYALLTITAVFNCVHAAMYGPPGYVVSDVRLRGCDGREMERKRSWRP